MRRSKALIKYRGRYGSSGLSIKILLKQLGLPRSVWCVRNFWVHWQGQFDYILYDAEKIYKRHAVRVHPRKETDDQEESKQLNALWMTIKARIKQHTHPSLLRESHRTAQKRLKPPKGYFLRTCLAAHCGEKFFAKSNKANYCCRSHMFTALNGRRYKEKKRERRRILVKCAFSKCGGLFWRYADLKKRRFCSPKCAQYHHCYDYAKRNRVRINKKQREASEVQREKRRVASQQYHADHKDELNAKKRVWRRKWRKRMKELKPVRRSLLDLLNLVGSHDRDIRNRCEAGDVAVRETILPINTDQVGAVLPDEHESIKLDIFCTLTAHNDQVVLGST